MKASMDTMDSIDDAHTYPFDGRSGIDLFASQADFDNAHHEAQKRMLRYVQRAHSNYQMLPRQIKEETSKGGGIYLYANAAEARARYSALAVRHFADLLEREQPEHVWMVTLASRDYAMSLAEAECADLAPLKNWAHQMLLGFSYFGMIDAAFYSRRKANPTDTLGTVSWHIHAFVWDVSEADLAVRIASINERVHSVVPGLTAAHASPVDLDRFAPRLRYVLKEPLNEYADWPKKSETVDPETGEIVIIQTGKRRQAKRPLRGGNQVRMAKVMAERTLDKLTIAGGGGRDLMGHLNAAALAPYREQQRKVRERRYRRELRRKRGRRSTY